MQVAFVRWSEVTGRQGWQDANDASALRPGECYSAGFIVHDCEDYLVVAGSRSDEGRVDAVISIPKSSIIKMTTVEFS